MTEQVVQVHARCEGCEHHYLLNGPGHTRKCPACGGVVRELAPDANQGHHLEQAIACPTCQAINPHAGIECTACGAALLEPLTAEELEEVASGRREVAHALRRGYRRMTTVTWLYRGGALTYALVTLLAIIALTQAEVPRTAGTVVVGLTTVLTVLMLVGAIQVPFRPFLWTVLLASIATLISVVHLLGPNPLGLMFGGTVVWACVFWAMLPSAREFSRLIDQYTDEYVLHHASLRTRRSLGHQSGESRHQRLLAVMRRAGARAWKVSAAAAVLVLLASAAGTYTVLKHLRPEEFSLVRSSFEQAWNSGNTSALNRLFAPSVREQQATLLQGLSASYGWVPKLPPLGAGVERADEGTLWVDYEVGGLPLSTHWALNDLRWRLVEVRLPEPPLEPVLERFVEAWNNSDLEAVASFVPDGYRERMHESFVLSAGYRDWDVLPKVLETQREPAPEGGGQVLVTLRLEPGVLTTRWLFRRSGRWGLQMLRFPER